MITNKQIIGQYKKFLISKQGLNVGTLEEIISTLEEFSAVIDNKHFTAVSEEEAKKFKATMLLRRNSKDLESLKKTVFVRKAGYVKSFLAWLDLGRETIEKFTFYGRDLINS